MVWTKANFVGSDVVVDVKGLDPKGAYRCVFTQAVCLPCLQSSVWDEANDTIKNITDAKFLADTNYKLNCGKQPTGFTINRTTSSVNLAIYVNGTSTQVRYPSLVVASDLLACIEMGKWGNV